MDDRTELEHLLHIVDEVMRQSISVPPHAPLEVGTDSEPLRLYDELIELIECERVLLVEGQGDADAADHPGLEDARSLTGQLERLRAQRQFWAGLPRVEH
ncbi:MAG: hypothetical protein J2P40_03825 [Candidatus Dormibacteraeota bacterium]|nr:hypothetical protein [Candidatus Dormibacteraeota bacterium]MBO0760384.1 hypothetical protein [Candidatus Dormibacteraeota bacterium]